MLILNYSSDITASISADIFYIYNLLYICVMEPSNIILKELKEIKDLLRLQNYSLKQTLSFEEATTYLGVSKSTLYKLTSENKITHYKPTGRLIYFQKDDLDAFLQQGRQLSLDDIIYR